MERCPTCDFPVLDEWSECRRCGARLSHEPHAPALPQRGGSRTGVRADARPVVTGPPPAQSRPVVPAAPMHDTLIPRAVRRPATIAAIVGAGFAAARLAGRRHRHQ